MIAAVSSPKPASHEFTKMPDSHRLKYLLIISDRETDERVWVTPQAIVFA